MASTTTYQGDVQRREPISNTIFNGQKLWFSRSVPARTWLIQNAELNGAQIVQLEQQADIKLVDHAKKNHAPGTYSYRYVELSIRSGQLEDLETHRVGSTSRVDRPVGSVVTASKGSRNRFTEAEDQMLWNWIKPFMDAGGAWKGLEIYKQIEAVHPTHTFQSWRDRWIKYTRYQERQLTSTPSSDQVSHYEQAGENPRSAKRRRVNEETPAALSQANTSALRVREVQPSSQVAVRNTMGDTASSQARPQVQGDVVRSETPAQGNRHEVEARNTLLDQNEHPLRQVHSNNANEAPNEKQYIKLEVADDDESSVSADGSRLPLAFNFTQEEARMLYKATCHILDARAEKLDESWSGVANEFGHTKDAWRTFFYDVIVPEYMKRNDLQNDIALMAHVKTHVGQEKQSAAKQVRNVENSGQEVSQELNETVSMQKSLVQESSNSEANGLEVRSVLRDGQDEQIPRDVAANSSGSQRSRLSQAPAYHVPQPNESRKLSHGRGSQFTSSESKSLSVSQRSERAQQAAVISHAAGQGRTPKRQDRIDLGQVETSNERHAIQVHIIRADQAQEQTEPNPAPAPEVLPSTPERDQSSPTFITQLSQHNQTNNSQSSAEVQDIPYRNPSPLQDLQSNAHLPALENTDVSASNALLQVFNYIDEDTTTNSDHVLLINEEEKGSEGRISEYASSEAPSEAIHFDTQIRLSQAWETAPEIALPNDSIDLAEEESLHHHKSEVARKPNPAVTDGDGLVQDAHEVIAISTADEASSNDSLESHLQERAESFENQSAIAKFETAPLVQEKINSKLDTQALFQLPTHTDFDALAAIPEPPGGWNEGDTILAGPTGSDNVSDMNAAEDADWTLPLPDPSADGSDDDDDDRGPSPSRESEGQEVDIWLANQHTTYPSTSSQFITLFSHRALESASMDLNIADAVLAHMIERLEKGKFPAQLSIDNLKHLPKRERTTIISKLANELVPDTVKGCWTHVDDKALLGMDAREVKRVEDKHGEDGIRNRFDFLEMWHSS